MANVLVDENSLKDIADSIREKNGTKAIYMPSEMPQAIKDIVSSGGNGLKYDMGEFVFDTDNIPQSGSIKINHGLGVIPEVIVVWTDDFADLTEENFSPYTTTTNLGFIWLDDLTGMIQRLTSSGNNPNGILIGGSLNANDYRANFHIPLSTSYTFENNTRPNENLFYIPKIGNNYYWRAGVTYRYFVSKAWWR